MTEEWKRGDPMPETRDSFNMMGTMYEKGFVALLEKNAKLRSTINDLRARCKGQHCARAERDDCGEIK